MGIRMNLSVGYGLDLNVFENLQADRSQLSFDDGAMESEERFAAFKADVEKWADATEHDGVMEKMIFHENCDPPSYLYEMVDFNDEFGLSDKMLLRPAMTRKEWHRYGDLLDIFLYEAQLSDTQMDLVPEWLPHPGALHPYIGLMKPNPEMSLGVEKYWEPCYRDKEEYKDAIAWAPWHLWFVIKHLRLWPEDKTTEAFLSLRPAIYRYFS